jgi:alpha-1,3-mannosyl-glycoprotein beta-1,2-N-acetylglucosaminyltransferase
MIYFFFILRFWDEYLRTPEVRRGRSCIFPEINRVKTFGKQGSSKGQFYDK